MQRFFTRGIGHKKFKKAVSEQKEIMEIISSIDKQIEIESKYRNQLNLLKKGLMQVLLTGKLRVAV